ncbi:MAG TPA: glycerophosphodiester phosphodiesterase [Acidimicrobiales bacterium]|nr:glycerophosphodiester phosphodiesterase [Acidimicrobiales bacterium]
MPVPLVLAHRGCTDGFVENTIAAFQAARRLGADGVELDVRRTADWALAVHHDPDLADGRPLATVAARDLPAEVPLLADALAACQGMVVNVEVKHDPSADPERALAGIVAAALADGSVAERVVLSSFDAPTLDVLRNAGLPVGWLLRSVEDVAAALPEAVDRGYQAVHPFVTGVDQAVVDQAHAAGLAVNVWTVNAPTDQAAMVAFGVDAIITDRLVEAVALVRGAAPNGETPGW